MLSTAARGHTEPALDSAARRPRSSHPKRIRRPRVYATAAQLSAFVDMARDAIQREYPVALVITLESEKDLGLPRALTPAFRGSFDWHSAVHGHWTLARGARMHPDAAWAEPAREALARSLTPEHLARE